MTSRQAANPPFVIGTSQSPRTATTVRLAFLMDEAQKLQMAERITDLRERSPFTQPKMAEKLGIGLRAYQKLEAHGTIRFERCEELAKIHARWTKDDPEWGFVNADWIWDGRRRDVAPNLMDVVGTQSQNGTELGRMEAKIDRIKDDVAAILAALTESDEAATAQTADAGPTLPPLPDAGPASQPTDEAPEQTETATPRTQKRDRERTRKRA